MATLAIPNGAPRVESVSCVCRASSRVGATTNTVTVDVCDLFEFKSGSEGGESSNRANAGIPNASVFPLPVSAIPTTSLPSNAGGQVHACTGVGSLNPVKVDRSFGGIGIGAEESWEKEIMGVKAGWFGGVWIVMEWVVRKA
jgi:hypothetical protein